MNGTQMSSRAINEFSESDTLNLPLSEAEVMTAVKRLKMGRHAGKIILLMK